MHRGFLELEKNALLQKEREPEGLSGPESRLSSVSRWLPDFSDLFVPDMMGVGNGVSEILPILTCSGAAA